LSPIENKKLPWNAAVFLPISQRFPALSLLGTNVASFSREQRTLTKSPIARYDGVAEIYWSTATGYIDPES